MELLEVVYAVLASIGFVAILASVVWCIYDVVVRAVDVDPFRRALWIVLLLGLNALAAVLYVRFGPGRERWSPFKAVAVQDGTD